MFATAYVDQVTTRELARRGREIAHAGLDLEALCLALDGLLRAHVQYAVASWSTHDPATGLFTSCTMTGTPKNPEGEAHLFRCEFREDEPSNYRSLIAAGETVAVLSEVTGGELPRASRFREIFSHVGVTDELRAVLWADGTAWGSATLLRIGGRFGPLDVDHLSAVAPHAADGMRLVLLRSAANRPEAVDEPPGILEVDVDGQVSAMTEPARRWLAIAGVDLITAANVTAAAVRAGGDWRGATARIAVGDGGVLSLHAATVTSCGGTVAVIVDRARPAEVSAMLVDAYGLTRRQRDVLGLLLLGRSMTQIAHSLGISEHTVHDHRKAIYRRIGVSSRSELAGLLQAEQYDPRAHRDTPPSPYGGFLEQRPSSPTALGEWSEAQLSDRGPDATDHGS